jgi:hypothetical protein
MKTFRLRILLALSTPLWATTVDWQQVGGSFVSGPTFKGILGQGYLTPTPVGANTKVQSGFLANPLLVRNAPFVASPLPDLREPAGFTIVFHLDSVFADLDGASLSYSVHTAGSGVAASVSGSLLNLQGTANANGAEQVFVTASDGVDSVSDTFQVATEASTAIASRPARQIVSHELAANIVRTFAPPAIGSGRGILGTESVQSENSQTVEVLLPGPGTVSVRIFDNLGTPVIAFEKELTESDLWRLPGSGDSRRVLAVEWNLRAADGTPVGSGVYLWKIEVATADGQKLETIKRLGVKGMN